MIDSKALAFRTISGEQATRVYFGENRATPDEVIGQRRGQTRAAHVLNLCPRNQSRRENIINRAFQATAPNEKWITDISEFHIPAGKVYLLPMIHCLDGRSPVGTSPDAELFGQSSLGVNKIFFKSLDADTVSRYRTHADIAASAGTSAMRRIRLLAPRIRPAQQVPTQVTKLAISSFIIDN